MIAPTTMTIAEMMRASFTPGHKTNLLLAELSSDVEGETSHSPTFVATRPKRIDATAGTRTGAPSKTREIVELS